MREVVLPSGAKLEIDPAPFPIANALKKAVAEEMRGAKFDPSAQVDVNLYKDLFCIWVSSPKIETLLRECFKRCTYSGNRIVNADDTFDPADARQDYDTACFEVAVENLAPFGKSLFAQFLALKGKADAFLA